MATETKAVLVISSQVARGTVGARAAGFAIERLGVPAWLVPTIWLPWHPGQGMATRIVPPIEAFASGLEDIAGSARAGEIGTVMTGYFADARQVEAVARLVERLRATNPALRLVVDPVIGDGGALYVAQAVAEAVRDRLLPLADVTTPNGFEAAWLSGLPIGSTNEAILAARALPAKAVVMTTAPAMMVRALATLLVTSESATQIEHPLIERAPRGTGDLLAGLLTARLARGEALEPALERAVASVFDLVARSVRAGADELAIAAEQDVLVHSMAQVSVRRIGETAARRRPPARPEVQSEASEPSGRRPVARPTQL